MQDIHQRMMSATTQQERRALMAEHGKIMRSALAVMQAMQVGSPTAGGMHGDGMGGGHQHGGAFAGGMHGDGHTHGGGMRDGAGAAGAHVEQQLALMRMMLQMMMDRIDMQAQTAR